MRAKGELELKQLRASHQGHDVSLLHTSSSSSSSVVVALVAAAVHVVICRTSRS